ncbi:ADP-ribosylation factor-like protein 15 isoform X2 [Cavia porcellus]|uniref:ADP-ribosylation factor-like protein 15 isoform X2 n=1 Tax=Cavia porcellus TaxID=10141 RepID=UPI002FE22B4F
MSVPLFFCPPPLANHRLLCVTFGSSAALGYFRCCWLFQELLACSLRRCFFSGFGAVPDALGCRMSDLRITEAFLYMDYLCFRALCCKGPPPARPEYDLVCIGLTGSGKTSLLSKLCSENPENVVSTTGADNIRKYWSRYYQGSQGVIFVLDSASSEDDLETARNELHSALQHPQLCTLPFLILANHQDKPAARSVQEIKKYFELEPLARGKRWILQPCSLDDMDVLKDSFSQLINLLEEKDHEAMRM